MHADSGSHLEAQACAQAREGSGERRDPRGRTAHVVEVFAVAVCALQVQLVEGCASPNDQLIPEVWITGDRADGTGQQQILFNLFEGWPLLDNTPGRDGIERDHVSGSSSRLR